MGRMSPATRVLAVLVLLILVAAALRGYLPAHHRSHRDDERGNHTALLFLAAVIAATLGLLAFSLIARLRDPQAAAPSAGELSDMLGRGSVRPSWRVVLIALGAIVAWLVLVILLSRLFAPTNIVLDTPQPDSSAAPTSAPSGMPTPKPQPRRPNGEDMLGPLLAFVPVFLMLFVGGFIVSRRRRRPTTAGDILEDHAEIALSETASESLVRAAESGLAAMTDLSLEPREAIIACYAAMERELANVPGAAPQAFDTPTEVLARAVEHHALHADNAVQLVNLFEEARFSPHVMNEGHRQTAVRVLELALDEMALGSVRST